MNRHPIVRFFRVLSVLALLLFAGLTSAILTMHFAIHGAEVQVPALKGMTVAQARSETAGLGLNLEVDNRYYSGEVTSGHILTQSPEPGALVRREWHVRVAESLGPQRVQVPNTVGSAQRAAELTLRRAGLEVTPPAHLPTSEVPEGTVLAQDPPAHAQDIAKPSVGLLIAAPPDELPDGYVMPDLTGASAPAAAAALAKIGVQAAPFQYVNVAIPNVDPNAGPPQPPVAPGSIIAQSPPAGARIDQSTIVKLTVAR
jgi:eukaryotic-like serine/threonine-protein kinase